MDWEEASDAERQQEAERRIAEAWREGSRRLDLGDLHLSRLPESLAELADLQGLALGRRGFGEDGQPKWFSRPNPTFDSLAPLAQLKGLRQLLFGPCEATSLEPVFGLSQLQSLAIEKCAGFSGELSSMAGLSQLQSLAIENCNGFSGELPSLASLSQLQSLSIGDCYGFSGELSSLAGLSQLQSLTIDHCTGFSGDLSSLAGLSQLQSLTINSCGGFSGELSNLAGLSQLQSLMIWNCGGFSGDLASLAGLSQLQSLNIGFCAGFSGDLSSLSGLSQLQSLAIFECFGLAGEVLQIPTLKTLQVFDCSSWVVTPATLRWYIHKKPALAWLSCQYVAGIPNEVLSDSVNDDCLARVQSYLQELEAGNAQEREVKLILLGNGRVGKTQLCRRLRGDTYEANSVSTHGVQLCRQKLELPGADGPATFHANWWDFGGQDIYHSTHSLFLRSRAIFLVLWAPGIENTEEFEENGIPMRNQPLVYWLDYLRSMAGGASPVIVVQSRCESFAARREPPVRAEGFDCVQYVHFGAANDHGRDGLEAALREALRYLAEKTGNLEIGVGRAELRRRLFELRDSGQRTLTRADYERLCAEIDSFVSPEHALDYFHQTGVAFYQPGLFGGQIVLDQSWALDAVYSVFQRARALPALRERGLFTRKDLEVLCWEGKSQEEQRLFLDLMLSCQICFVQTRDWSEAKEHVYLAPDLLPPYQKVESQLFAWFADRGEVTSLHVEYRFLHQAVLRSLISDVGTNVGPNAVYWKYGLWLRTTSGSQLLIRQEAATTFAGPGAGAIVLSAKGPEAFSLLSEARQRLEWQAVHEKPLETFELAGARVPRSALASLVDNKVRAVDGRLFDARPFDAFFAGKIEAMNIGDPETSRIEAAPLPKPEVFLSYAWGDDESSEGRLRAEAADLLCTELRRDFVVHRDRDAIQAGESISDYIDKLTHGQYLVALVSDKYLRSPYCMFEIYKLYQACMGEKKQMLERVVPVVLPEVKIARLPERAQYLKYWSAEAKAYEELMRDPDLRPGESSVKEYRLVRDFANHVDEILVFIADVIMPRRVDDFSAVREALRRKMGLA